MNTVNYSITEQPTLSPDIAFEETKEYPELVRYVALIIGIPFIFVGITGNLLTIIAVMKTKSLRKSNNLFIISLAMFDLTYSFFVIPTAISVNFNNAWIFGDGYCSVYPIIQFLTVCEVLLSISGLALSRYLKIIHPSIFNSIFGNKLYTALLLSCFWSVPVFLLLPPMIGVWGSVGYEPKTLTCTITRDGSNYNLFLLVCAYMIPISFITFCYLRILCKVCSNHKKVHAARQQLATETMNGNFKTGRREQREDLRYTRMMVAIFIVFLMAYAPYFINNILDPDHRNMARGFFTSSCAWFSPCLNPVLYVLLNRQFRRAFLTILPCNCGRCNPEMMEQSVTQLSQVNT